MTDLSFRVLIAENEMACRWMMVQTLRTAGYDVLEASDGVEACWLIKNPDHISVLVTDIDMPGADGIAVAECARESKPDVPILFLGDRYDLLVSHPNLLPYSCLSKPFEMNELTSAVSRLVLPAPLSSSYIAELANLALDLDRLDLANALVVIAHEGIDGMHSDRLLDCLRQLRARASERGFTCDLSEAVVKLLYGVNRLQ